MRQYFSIFALSARSTLFKLLAVILGSALIEIGLFYWSIKSNSYGILLEELMDESFVKYVFLGALMAYMVILCTEFNGKNPTKSAMTTSRLGIKESAVCWTMAIYNMCMLVVFFAAQLFAVLLMCQMYLHSDLAGDYQHSVFIAFYRNGLMHGLLPLDDYWTYVENAMCVIGLGICASYTAKKQRRGKQDALFILLTGAVLISFCERAEYYYRFNALYTMIPIFIYMAYYISKGGALDEEEINEPETATPQLD